MKNILITGGAVHAYLDDVKIITNKFKGGLMAKLANDLACLGKDVQITYLSSKTSELPPTRYGELATGNIPIYVYHDGVEDYMQKVLSLAPKMDAVILGAAVANLIPKNKIVGKFPSHNYKVGDTIPIEFTIAPRIIDEVKKVAPHVHLFGFKLLSGVTERELVDVAYNLLLESKATAIIANDAKDLTRKYIVTKEKGITISTTDFLARELWLMINDEYYKTEDVSGHHAVVDFDSVAPKDLVEKYKDQFKNDNGIIFGCIAKRISDGSFIISARGKKSLNEWSWVKKVDHENRIVYAIGKASLNAPLIDKIFKENPDVNSVVHVHSLEYGLRFVERAIPGTVRDSCRDSNDIKDSFNVASHGCYILVRD